MNFLSRKFRIQLITLILMGAMLITPTSTFAASPKSQTQWFQQNAHEVKSLTSEDYRDLAFLKPLLKNKTVVSLGENFHRVAEYSSAKTRLIKYLHEELGFDVIAFESGMGDAAAVYENRDKLNPESMMAASLFPIWHSQETLELFKYIKEQGQGPHPLYLAGFDMQFNSYYLTQVIAEALAKIDMDKAKAFAKMDKTAIDDHYKVLNSYGAFTSNNPAFTNEIKQIFDQYEPQYTEILTFVQKNRQALTSMYPDNPHKTDFIIRSLKDRINFLKMPLQEGVEGSYSFRDRLMLDNLEWQMKNVFPGKKVILWAHNDHLSKNTSKILAKEDGKWVNSFTSIGELLHHKLKDKLYVVGLYMNQGAASTISTSKPFTISPMPKGSLENLFMSSGYKNAFVDLSSQKKMNKYNSWMWRPILAAEDGMTAEIVRPNAMKFIPKEQYDGILVINKVKAPTPIDYSLVSLFNP
ncbi:Erythromycin esterase [compost metagenome]